MQNDGMQSKQVKKIKVKNLPLLSKDCCVELLWPLIAFINDTLFHFFIFWGREAPPNRQNDGKVNE